MASVPGYGIYGIPNVFQSSWAMVTIIRPWSTEKMLKNAKLSGDMGPGNVDPTQSAEDPAEITGPVPQWSHDSAVPQGSIQMADSISITKKGSKGGKKSRSLLFFSAFFAMASHGSTKEHNTSRGK